MNNRSAGFRSRHPRRRSTIAVAALLAALVTGLIAWGIGFTWFAGLAAAPLDDVDTPTDAIVVLTGGSMRLTTGLSLLAADRAEKLFVSGVYHGVDVQELLSVSRQAPTAVECCIVLGYAAGDTRGNAAEIALWFSTGNYRSLRLVTANYHMRRSLAELRHTMPKVRVIPHPVFPSGVTAGGWWRNGTAITVLIKEYNKYLAALVRLRFA